MRKYLLAAVLFCCGGTAYAQGGLWDNPVIGANGRPIIGASAQVCTAIGVQGSLCTPTTTVYSNQALSTALTYPLKSDAQGNLTFWVAPGVYYLTVYGNGIRTTTRAISVACLPGTGCALTGTASALTTATANPATSGVIRLAVGDTACWRNNASGGNLCLSINGSDALLFNGSGLVQTGVANIFTANQTFPTIISSTASPATGGWGRLANSDQFCWRNGAGSANNCLAISSDRLTYLGGNVVTNSSTDTMTTKTLTAPVINSGVTGTGFQHVQQASCATPAPNTPCTQTVTWPLAFADENYVAVCGPETSTAQVWISDLTGKIGASVDVNIYSPTGGATTTISCIGVHN